MDYKNIFIEFMKQNKAFKEWKDALNEYGKTVEDNNYVERALNYMNNSYNAPQALDNGIIFFYDKSPNKGYWNNLNFKWKEYLNASSNANKR